MNGMINIKNRHLKNLVHIIIRVELLICMVPELAQKDYRRLNSYIYKLVLQIYWSRGIPQKQSERQQECCNNVLMQLLPMA